MMNTMFNNPRKAISFLRNAARRLYSLSKKDAPYAIENMLLLIFPERRLSSGEVVIHNYASECRVLGCIPGRKNSYYAGSDSYFVRACLLCPVRGNIKNDYSERPIAECTLCVWSVSRDKRSARAITREIVANGKDADIVLRMIQLAAQCDAWADSAEDRHLSCVYDTGKI